MVFFHYILSLFYSTFKKWWTWYYTDLYFKIKKSLGHDFKCLSLSKKKQSPIPKINFGCLFVLRVWNEKKRKIDYFFVFAGRDRWLQGTGQAPRFRVQGNRPGVPEMEPVPSSQGGPVLELKCRHPGRFVVVVIASSATGVNEQKKLTRSSFFSHVLFPLPQRCTLSFYIYKIYIYVNRGVFILCIEEMNCGGLFSLSHDFFFPSWTSSFGVEMWV